MRLLCALVAICGSGIAAASQAVAPVTLPDALRAHVKQEHFDIVTSLRGLPLGVREALQTLFGTPTLDIADSGEEFQLTKTIATSKLPTRRMIAAGCSADHHCIVYYERSGSPHSWHVALFHWRPGSTRFEWGGVAPRGLKSVEEVRKAMLSGAIKGPSKVW